MSAIRDFRSRLREFGLDALRQYNRWESLQKEAKALGESSVVELDVSRGHRMLAAHRGRRFVFIALGPHEDERRWERRTKKWLSTQIEGANPLPRAMGRLDPCKVATATKGAPPYYHGEDAPEWMFYLDGEQARVLGEVQADVEEHLLSDKRRPMLRSILGGPGTGKTVILLKLFQWAMNEKFIAAMDCSDGVRASLEAALGKPIPDSASRASRELDLLLIDDPSRTSSVRNAMKPHDGSPPRCVVAAFDPLQMDELPSEESMEELDALARCRGTSVRTCYRQRKELAKRVIEVTDALAKSNAFLDESKMAEWTEYFGRVLKQYNEMDTVYPLGHFAVLPSNTPSPRLENMLREVHSSKRNWTHRPYLLCAYDDEVGMARLPCLPGNPRKLDPKRVTTIPVGDAHTVKGVEFQHAILCLGKSTFDEMTDGFTGSGQRRFHWRRGLRILLSRPRDTLVIVTYTPGQVQASK